MRIVFWFLIVITHSQIFHPPSEEDVEMDTDEDFTWRAFGVIENVKLKRLSHFQKLL